MCLVTGGQKMKDEINKIIDCFADRPHIFNLGHGVLPHTRRNMFETLLILSGLN